MTEDSNLGIKINFKPSRKQFEALSFLMDKETNFVGYGGSAYSGKSYLLCYFLTMMSVRYPGTGWGLGRKELTVLKKTTLFTLFKVFEESNIKPDAHYIYNQQLNIITFYNDSQIFLIDTETKPSDPLFTRFGGLELTGCAVDESAETSGTAIDILFTRIGRRKNHEYGIGKKFLETFNPSKNHVYHRYYKPWRDNKLQESYQFVKALPKDNPSPDVEDYIKGIMDNAQEVTIQRLVYGNFEYDDDPAALIQYDKIIECFTNDHLKAPKSSLMYITADIARFGSDKTVIGLWYSSHHVELISYTKQSISETATKLKEFAAKFGLRMDKIIADEDGVGGGVIDILKCRGFVNNSKPLPNPVTRKDDNYNNLKSQCYYMLADKINSGSLYIECSDIKVKADIIQELEQVKQFNMDKDGKKQILPKEKVKELIGRSPDYSDTLMMRELFDLKSFHFIVI